METPTKPSKIMLKSVPSDVYKSIIAKQNEIKSQRGINMFSMEKAIYIIIQEWEEFKKAKK